MSFFDRVGASLGWPAFFCLDLSIAALLRVDRRGGFSSLSFPVVTLTVGFYPSGYFRRCLPFLDLFKDFHPLEHCTNFPVGL